jgi:ATP-dependent DNA ligase
LGALLAHLNEPALAYSDGMVGGGRAFFAQAVAGGHEGVMAKRLASRYAPGKRSAAWRKIKPVAMLPCVVVGYTAGRDGVQRLLVATVREGVLRYVGQLRPGLSQPARLELAQRRAWRRRSRPLVACPQTARWVEPERYCRVEFGGWTPQGRLRKPVFRGWIEEPA